MNIEEAKANIGKEVVLDESTKPYTFISFLNGVVPKCNQPNKGETFTISDIESMGNVILKGIDSHKIHPKHIKIKEKNIISTLSVDLNLVDLIEDIDIFKLRLEIFNGNTSRTLEEMIDIEKWILGE